MNIKELVGKNLALIRNERSISLQTLSRITGMSEGTLSEIEKGATNPTIAALWKIANGLKIPFSDLIKSEQNIFEIVRANSGKTITENENGVINTIHEYDENGKTEMYEQIIYPGRTQISPPHGDNVVEYVYVKQGTLEFKTENKMEVLKSGDSMKFIADSERVYTNRGSEILDMLIFITYF